jgi:hypothetical protein
MFVQVIEGRTSDPEGLLRRGERWMEELRPGATGFLGATMGVTSDGRAINLARFESADKAKANSDRPEQGEWWAETQQYYDGEVSFIDSEDVEVFRDGGSDEAGFVQVMKSSGVDREAVARLDAQFERFADARPDLLGMIRVWTGPSSCVEAAYFTSEAEAREGERSEIPEEMRETLAEFEEMSKGTEYLDLTDPVLI